MGLPMRASGAKFTACEHTQRIRRSTRIAAYGIARGIRSDEEVAGELEHSGRGRRCMAASPLLPPSSSVPPP
jgi:hypothetical protein